MRRAARLATAIALLATAPASADPGPALTEPQAARLAAVRCYGDVARSPRLPVLLVHGTGVTPEENWPEDYQPVLLRRGHSVCTVAMPDYGYGDVQRSVEYVVTAIREVRRRSGRRISIIGQSQGGLQPTYALRVWPDLAAGVEDFIGLAGVYDNGSEAMIADCGDADGCVPSFQQMKATSSFLGQLRRRPLPPGASYTAIGTLADQTVTPQPKANELPGARSVQIQDVCPGRRMPAGQDHVLMAGDAVAYELAIDALDHEGPADPARVPRAACDKLFFDGVDYVTFATVAPAILTREGTPTTAEPRLRCHLQPACADPDARGRLLAGARVVPGGGRRIALELDVQAPGLVQIRVRRGRRVVRTVRREVVPGARRVAFAARPGRYRVDVVTRPDGFTADTRERTLPVAVR